MINRPAIGGGDAGKGVLIELIKDNAEAVRLQAVTKVYGSGASAVRALGGVDLDLPAATFTAVMGPSGSGKSTMLHCAAGLDRPTSGSVWLGSVDLAQLTETELTGSAGNDRNYGLTAIRIQGVRSS